MFSSSQLFRILSVVCVINICEASVEVTLEPFDIKNALTNCSKNLLSNNNITLYGSIITNGPIVDMSGRLVIYFKRKDQQEQQFGINQLKECFDNKPCGMNNICCNITDNVIRIWIALPALTFYSEAEMRFTVYHHDQNYNSNSVTFPKIIDPSEIEITSNNIPLNKHHLSIAIKEGEHTVTTCCQNAPEPCIPFSRVNFFVEQNRSSNCVTFSVKGNKTGIVPINYEVCGHKIYSLPDKNEANHLLVIILAIISVILGIVIITCCLVWKKILSSMNNKTNRGKKQEDEPLNTEEIRQQSNPQDAPLVRQPSNSQDAPLVRQPSKTQDAQLVRQPSKTQDASLVRQPSNSQDAPVARSKNDVKGISINDAD